MPYLTHNIWGRDFNLDVRFEDLNDEGISPEQRETFDCFAGKAEIVDEVLPSVVDYCLKNNASEIDGTCIDNIFRYVVPEYVFIPRILKDRMVSLMCAYRFDLEHGLAIVFRNEKLVGIGPQDMVL